MEILRTKSNSELTLFLSYIKIICWIQQQFGDIWDEANNITEVGEGIHTVKVNIDMSFIVGMPHTEILYVPVSNKIYLDFSGAKSPLKGSHLMIWGYSKEIKTIYFWTTEMFTVYSQGKHYDPPKTSESSATSLSYAPSGRGGRTPSSCN